MHRVARPTPGVKSPPLERGGAPAWLVAAGVMASATTLLALAAVYGHLWAFGGLAVVVVGVSAMLRWAHPGQTTWGDVLVACGPAVWLAAIAGLPLLAAVPLIHRAAVALGQAASRVLAAAVLAAVVLAALAAHAGTAVAVGGTALAGLASAAGDAPSEGPSARGPPPSLNPIDALMAAGCDVQGTGPEYAVALPGETHHHLKINSTKGVYLDAATGVGGTLSALLSRLGIAAGCRHGGHRGDADARITAQRAKSLRGARKWRDMAPLSAEQQAEAQAALDLYMRRRGFPAGVLDRADLRPTLSLRTPWGAASQPPIYYVAHIVVTLRDPHAAVGVRAPAGSTARGPDAIAVLAIHADGTKAAPDGWGGDCRHTYGPRPPGSHRLLHPLREDLVPLAGLPPEGPRYVVGEGMETTLAAMLAVGGSGVECIDAGHIGSLLVPPRLRAFFAAVGAHLVIAADREPSDAGPNNAAKCVAWARAAGIPALVLPPPAQYGPKADWADALLAGGPAGAEAAARNVAAEQDRAARKEEVRRVEATILAALKAADDDDGTAPRSLPTIRRDPSIPAPVPPAHDPGAAAAALARARADLEAAAEGRMALSTEAPALAILAPATGTGKSTAFARAAAWAARRGADLLSAAEKAVKRAKAADTPAQGPTALQPQRLTIADAPPPVWRGMGASVHVAATRAQRDALALVASAVPVPARTPDPTSDGYCARYEDVVQPLAERERGIAPHACNHCPVGLATMNPLRAATGPIPYRAPKSLAADGMCPYIYGVERSRREANTVATAAKLAGDTHSVPVVRLAASKAEGSAGGEAVPRAIVIDDCSSVTRTGSASQADVAEWVRTAPRQAAADEAAACRLAEEAPPRETDEERAARERARRKHSARAEALRQAQPHLEAVNAWITDHATETTQTRLPADLWPDLARIVKSPAMSWIDSTGAEAIFLEEDGSRTIPLRALRDLMRAVTAGTCWLQRGTMYYFLPAEVVDLARAGHAAPITWLDATPPASLLRTVTALGGVVPPAPDPQPTNLHITLRFAGGHGKVACGQQPSQDREQAHLLTAIRDAAQHLSAGAPLSVITHRGLAVAVAGAMGLPDADGIRDEGYSLPADTAPGHPVSLGWWGRHNTAHNAWQDYRGLLVWGTQTMAPTDLERLHIGQETVIADCGGTADPTWDGTRTRRDYPVPGRPDWTISCDGYARDDIDTLSREWSTGRLVQAVGRLRATARPHDHLHVIIYSTSPLAPIHGLRIDEVRTDAPWRTQPQLSADRRADTAHRAAQAVVGLRRTGSVPTRRSAQRWLRARGLQGIGDHTWGLIATAAASVSAAPPLLVLGPACRRRAAGRYTTPIAGVEVVAAPPRLAPGWHIRVLARRLRTTTQMRAPDRDDAAERVTGAG